MANMHQIGKHKTSIKTVDGLTTVNYISTDVVRFTDNIIMLDTGGWNTVTTRRRMNQASAQFDLHYRVCSERGSLWCHYKVGNYDNLYKFENRRLVLDRKTGMMITEEQNDSL